MALFRTILLSLLVFSLTDAASAQSDIRNTDLYRWVQSDDRSWTNVRRVQRALQRLGYRPGLADGIFGPRTQQAIADWQRDTGQRVSGLGLPPGAAAEVVRRRCAGGITGSIASVISPGGACY